MCGIKKIMSPLHLFLNDHNEANGFIGVQC